MITEIIKSLLGTDGFPLRWLYSSGWTPELGWIHIISDIVIFVSYTAIPIAILIYLNKINVKGYKHMLCLFVLFILFCDFDALN